MLIPVVASRVSVWRAERPASTKTVVFSVEIKVEFASEPLPRMVTIMLVWSARPVPGSDYNDRNLVMEQAWCKYSSGVRESVLWVTRSMSYFVIALSSKNRRSLLFERRGRQNKCSRGAKYLN